MDFFLFGPPSRSLFGCFHEGVAAGPAAGVAVLLCPPWGQEAIRTQRMFRVLAERLARAGAQVLRFDYHGTGDSPGDDLAVDLDGCAQDVAAAHARLLSLTKPRRVVWVSVRLGATVALQALARGLPQRCPDHVLAWEPVIDGAAYLEMLRTRHVDALEASYTVPDPAWRRALQADPASYRDEAMGFALSDKFREQLAALRPDTLVPPPSLARLSVLLPTLDGLGEALQARLAAQVPRLEVLPLAHDFDWTSEEALNTALVPGSAVQALFDLCTGT